MKTATGHPGLFTRLGFGLSVLLLGQYALAVGVDPGVQIDNTALVDYEVNNVGQTQLSSNTASFVVDRRVDFEVVRTNTALTPTNLSDTDGFLEFYVKNTSNGTLDFNLSTIQLVTADGDIYGVGTADTGAAPGDVDMNNVRISVGPDFVADGLEGTGADPLVGTTDPYIDDLPEDFSVRVRIYADTPGALANGDIAGLRLVGIAADPSGTTAAPGANLTESGTWNELTVDNVFADTDEDNVETAIDGFVIQSAQIVVTKSAAVISDPINGVSPNARAIPGAIIEYTIEIDNSAGTDSADSISVGDIIDANVALVEQVAGVSTITIIDNVGGTSTCNAETGGVDSDGDGCVYGLAAATTLTVAPNAPALSVPATETWRVTFQVEIQ